MLRIGEFARLAKVSIKLLRHYDQIGLLKAHTVDRATGYRYYSVSQLATLNRLLVYRSLGFTLQEIRRLVRRDTAPEDLRDMLTARRTALAARVEAERARLAEVEARIAQIERDGRASPFEVAIRTAEATAALSLRRVCASYEDVGDLLGSLRRSVPARARIRGCGAIWHRCTARHADIECEALVFVDAPDESRVNGVRRIELPACTVASVVHEDALENPALAYRAAVERAATLGYRIAGPMREIYLGSDSDGAAVTEVQFPIAPRQA